MKQEHEMTPGVLVSDDSKPLDPTATLEALVAACWDFSGESADGALAAAPAPVERVELMTWPQAVDRAARLIDEEQERLTAEGYFMDSDDCCNVLRESVDDQQPAPAPTAAQDAAGLVDALEQGFPLFNDDGLDEVEHHCEWAIQQDRKRLHALIAAHQQREG